MWKSVTRGIRDSLERRICRTNVYSQSSQDSSSSGDEGKVFPRDKFLCPKFSAFYQICCKHTGQVDAKDEESQKQYDAKYTWSEAFGWSSILAVGYVVCQSLCIRRKLFEIDNSNKFDKWRDRINPHLQASRLFNHFLLPPPKYILPVSTKPVQSKIAQEIIVDTSNQQPYGPITAEEALEQAINEFSKTHNSIMGELELDCGSRAIEEERYDEAIEHFTTGANFSSVESMFNLALCYELGLGTSTDFEKAVKYYKEAADKGHADAMYNLGVFYAQGKGGLKTNLDTARQLFTEAAKKGQAQASQALELEKSFNSRLNSKRENQYLLKVKPIQNSTENSIMAKLMNYDSIFTTNFKNQTAESDQFNVDSYDTSPTSIFLDMLGVHERSAIPLISVGESGP